MRLFDITLPVSQGLPVWPGDPSVAVEPTARIANGAKANLSRIDMGSHTGTHIDAPFHFNDNGLTVDRLPLEFLIGRVSVIEIGEEKRAIDKALLESIGISNIERVLFKTGNSRRYRHEFVMDFTALTPDGAEFLVKKGVKVVGIDYLSIERYGSKDHRVHHLLLDSGVIIIEGLYLKDVKPGDYELIALPLKLKGGDGAPARVVLRGGDI
ncbi:MAG: cyclase family protein [Nitrospirae bacterium]|nr:cyclase family protein [Nitrospirota bacterium]